MPYEKEFQQERLRRMIITGKGQVTAVPDLAVIRLGVMTNGMNLVEIQNENAQITNQVLEALRELGIEDIKTFQYAIDKVYEYEDGNRIDRGYSVRNLLEIRITNMELIGSVIDTAVSNGANMVELINFELSDPDFYYQQALNLAVANAYQKAQSISDSIGISLDAIPILITENSNLSTPFSPVYFMREKAAVTPIEPGNLQIDAMVTIEFTY